MSLGHKRLLNAGNHFKSKFRILNGPFFYGQLLGIPDTSRVSNFLSPRRYLRTRPDTVVRYRDIVVVEGVNYIVGEHGEGFYNAPIYKHFKLFQVDETLEWFKAGATIDPVTGAKKILRDQSQGNVYLSSQPNADIIDELKMPIRTRICVCNAPLQPDDKVGEWLVIKSDVLLGVNIVTLKRS